MPALRGEPWQGRDLVFAEHPTDGVYEGPFMTMVRSERYKLVHFVGEEYGQLFDLQADPGRGTQSVALRRDWRRSKAICCKRCSTGGSKARYRLAICFRIIVDQPLPRPLPQGMGEG